MYGYALASDTGGFISGEVGVDVDLFYETYRESALNSLRTVDIYVLEWGQRDAVLLREHPKNNKTSIKFTARGQKLGRGFYG